MNSLGADQQLSALLAILDSSLEGVLIVDHRSRRVLHYNRRFLELLGIPQALADELDDNKLIQFVLDRLIDPAAFLAVIEELYEHPERTSDDELLFKDGRVFQRHSVPLHTEAGLLGRAWYFRELTDLRAANRQLGNLFDNLVEGVIVRDTTGRVVKFNAAALDILGVTESQLTDTPPAARFWKVFREDLTICPPEEYPATLALKTGRQQKGQLVGHLRLDGQIRWVETTATPLFRERETEPFQILITFHDVTEKTQSANALQKALLRSSNSEKSFRAIFDHSPIGIIQLDAELRYVSVNAAHAHFLGYTEAELKTMKMMDVTHPDDRELSLQAVASFAGTDIPLQRLEKRYLKKSGETVWGLVSSRSIRFEDAGEHYLFSVIEDITEIKRRETELKAAEAKLVFSSKMSLLGEMAGGVAHEINNPLAIIHGKAGQLKNAVARGDVLDPARILRDLGKIEATADRIDRIIKGLRLFSRNADADPMETALVAPILEGTLELCKERLKRHAIDFRMNCDADATIECRPTQVSQIIMNLVSNSYDAVEQVPEKWIALDVVNAGGSVKIVVTDSGRGIPAATANKIMQPFFTTKEPGKGTGLGLSISKGIAEEHGGWLSYDASSENTRFVLELPRRQAKEHYPI